MARGESRVFNRRDLRNLPCRAKPHPKPNQNKKTNEATLTHSVTSQEVKNRVRVVQAKKTMLTNEHNLAINNLGWIPDKNFQSL